MEEELHQRNLALAAAHEAVKAERQRYQELFDLVPDGYLVTNGAGVIQEANRAAAALLQVSQELLVGKPLQLFVVPEFYGSFQRRLTQLHQRQALEASGQKWEMALQPPEAPSFPAVLTVAPRRDAEGRIINLHWLLRDISERKRGEEILRESEAFNRAVLNSLEAHVAVLSPEGLIIAVNEAWEQFGRENGANLPTQRGVGLNYLEICRQTRGREIGEAERALAGIQAVLAGRENRFILEYSCHSPRERRWFLMYVTPLSKRRGGAVVSHLNITSRKQVEEALQESNARLDAIISTATDAIITIDARQRILLFNGAAEQMFQLKADEIIGQPLHLLLPDRHRSVYEQYVAYFSQATDPTHQRGVMSDELWGRRANGEEFPIEATISQVEVAGQNFYTVILRDVSIRKQAEAERSRLFEAVNWQRKQLRALTARLAEAQEVERKGLARELHDQVGRNLTALSFNLNIVSAQLIETLPEVSSVQIRLEDSLALVEQTVQSIRDLMADLRPPVLDDYGLVAALRWYGVRVASRTGFTVIIQGEEPVPRLAPPVENALFRVAQEALANVAKHAQATQVIISVETTVDLVRLVIADNGRGFEPPQLGGPTGLQGWGLLSMSERAEAVGAHCRLESALGQGTYVIVEKEI